MLFYIGYLLQNKAKEKQLIDYQCNYEGLDYQSGILGDPGLVEYEEECYSLVHIGADYGDVLDVDLGDMRKMISQTVWNAANNYKEAPRTFKKDGDGFIDLPIKI